MKILLSTALVAAAMATDMNPVEFKFFKWIAEHSKTYGSRSEYEFRFNEFLKTHEELEEFHRNHPNTHITVGHNKFSDWTKEELAKLKSWKPLDSNGKKRS